MTKATGHRTPGRTRLPSAEQLERERKALELRRARATYDQIAQACGYKDHTGAWSAVQRAIGRVTQGNAEQLRAEEADMLDRLHRAWWPLALGGDDKAAGIILRTAERRAKLLGLDMPIRVHTTITDALDAQIEELVSQLADVARMEAEQAQAQAQREEEPPL